MPVELARQEVEIWKKVIRIISHELNNSLAPISSLAHSGKLIARRPGISKNETSPKRPSDLRGLNGSGSGSLKVSGLSSSSTRWER